MKSGLEGIWSRPEKEYGDEAVDERDHKGDFEGVEVLDEKKRYEYSTEDGPNAFKDIDLSNGGGIFLDVLGVESTPVGEKHTLDKCHGEEDQERRIKNRPEPEPLSWIEEKKVSECPGEIKGYGKGDGKKQLGENKDSRITFCLFSDFTNEDRPGCHQDKPVRENDSKGEFVSMIRDQKFSHEDDLGGHPAQPFDEKRGLKESGFHTQF